MSDTPVKVDKRSRHYLIQVSLDTFSRWGARIGLFWVITIVVLATFSPVLVNSMPYLVKIKGEGWSSPFLKHLGTYDVMLFTIFVTFIAMLLWKGLTFKQRFIYILWNILTALILTGWGPLAEMLVSINITKYRFYNELLYYKYSLPFCIWLVAFYMPFGFLLYRRFFSENRVIHGVGLFTLWFLLLLPWVLNPINPPKGVIWSEYRDLKAADMIEEIYMAPIEYSPLDHGYDDYNPNSYPTSKHLLGTDKENTDVMGRMIYATRIALTVGFISTTISLTIGIIVGGLMGYFSGFVDLVGMRLVEIFSAIPSLFLILAFIAFYGKDLYAVMLIIGLVSWPGYAMYIRAEYLKLRKMEYVQAGISLGLPLHSILFKHILPNGIAPTLVSATFGFASAIATESVLSFLSLVDAASWGQLLSQATAQGGGFYMWVVMPPGIAIFFTVFAYNLIGESLRDAIDPHTKKQA